MSVEDLEKSRYGLEIARLDVSQASAKKALSFAKPGIVTDAVIADIKVCSGSLKSADDALVVYRLTCVICSHSTGSFCDGGVRIDKSEAR